MSLWFPDSLRSWQKNRNIPRAQYLIFVLFFISGALALTYEVVWTRMMTNILGSTAVAVGTVLAAFMSGMAIGSYKVGKYADRSRNCLRLYAWLEMGIAASALASHLVLSRLDHAQAFGHIVSGSAAHFGVSPFHSGLFTGAAADHPDGGHTALAQPLSGGQVPDRRR